MKKSVLRFSQSYAMVEIWILKYGFVSREKHRFELLEVDQQYQHFLTPLSDFRLCEPILDNSVRFWTEVFDFGPKYPILGTIVRLWTLASGYKH